MSPLLLTHRHLLTSLLNTLTTATTIAPDLQADNPPSNPLKHASPSQKAILTTLHVLFPPPMLLQSLDLLDRGLVTKIIYSSPAPTPNQEAQVMPPQTNIHLSSPPALQSSALPPPQLEFQNLDEGNEKENNSVYLVQSSQVPKSRFSHSHSSTSGSAGYIVHLTAWNCSCAAFAFSAFPSGVSSSPPPWDLEGDVGMIRENVGDRDGDEMEWEFGWRSLDGKGEGKEGNRVPVCKHLLAAVLVERWDLLRGFVKERVVGREEMAGLCGS